MLDSVVNCEKGKEKGMSKSCRESCSGCSRIPVRKLGLYEAERESASWKEAPSGARPVNQIELGGACVRR